MMDKKIGFIILISIACIVTISTSAAAYSHTSELQLFDPDLVGNDIDIFQEGGGNVISVNLLIDGKESYYRGINYVIYNDKGERIVQGGQTPFWPICMHIYEFGWMKVGKYRLLVQYPGSPGEGIPPAMKSINVTIHPRK